MAPQLAGPLTELAHELTWPARVGVDAVHVPTWRRHLELGGHALVERTYREQEIEFCAGRPERFSSRLAGKESVLKVLGSGIRGTALRDVEIVSERSGRPTVLLHGPAAALAAALGLARVEVSLCHEHEYAMALAVGVNEPEVRG